MIFTKSNNYQKNNSINKDWDLKTNKYGDIVAYQTEKRSTLDNFKKQLKKCK